MALKKQNLGSGNWDWLSALGFSMSEARPGIWEYHEPQEENKNNVNNSWQFRHLSMDTNLDDPQLLECEMYLSFDAIARRLKQRISSEMETNIVCDIVKCKDGDVLVSVNAPISVKGKGCPQSYLGFKFHVSQNRGDICVYFYDYLAIQYPPVGLLLGLSAFTQEFFGNAATEAFDFIKSTSRLSKFFSQVFQACFQSSSEAEALANLGGLLFGDTGDSIAVEISDKGIKLSYVVQNETGLRPNEMGLPVNALEIVELHSEYAQAVADISMGESGKTFAAIGSEESKHCSKLGLDLLGFSGLSGANEKEIYEYVTGGAYRDSITAWSFVVTYLLGIKEKEKALDELSHFAAELLKIAPESLESHGFVLAELLGDLWAQKDPAVAHRFYRNVLKKYGDIPRILNKIVSISSKAVTADEEISLLKKSLKIEEAETNYLARISDLYAGQGKIDEAIHFGVKALHGGYVTAELVLAVTQLYLRQNQPRQALQHLDEYANGEHGFTTEHLAEMHTLAGDLWLDQLNKPKLALRRFIMAIELCPQYAPVYERLERVYDKNGEFDQLVSLFEKKIEVLPADDKKAINYYLRICQIDNEQKVGSEQKWRSFKTLVQRNLLNDANIERSLDEDLDSRADWASIVNSIEQQLLTDPTLEQEEAKAKRLGLIARIHDERLKQPAVSANFLQKANKFSKINTEVFQRLVQQAESSDSHLDPGEVLNDRMKHLDTNAKSTMLRNMTDTKDMALSDLRPLAVQQFLLNSGQNDLFMQAFGKLMADGNSEKFAAFLLSSLGDVENIEMKNEFILMTLDFLKDKTDAIVSRVSCFLFDEFVKVSHDHEERARALAKHLMTHGDHEYAPYLKEAIEHGHASLFAEARVLEVLGSDPKYLVNYLVTNPLLGDSTEKRFAAAKHALSYAKQIEEEPNVSLMTCYSIMATSGLMSIEEIEEYRLICMSGSTIEPYIQCLEFQMQQIEHAKHRLEWCLAIGEICESAFQDSERALQYFEAATMLDPTHLIGQRHVIRLLAKLGKNEEEKSAWQRYVGLSDFPNAEELKAFITRGGELFTSHELERLLIDRVQGFIGDAKFDEAHSFLNHVTSCGIKTYDLLMLKAGISDNAESCVSSIVEATALIDDIGLWYDHIASAETMYIKYEKTIEDLYRALVLAAETVSFSPRIMQEIFVFLANWLVANTDNKADAFLFYGQAYSLDKEDLRVWLPYYYLIKEIGSPELLIEYLDFLIPELELNQDLLESHDVTLQSLNMELDKVKSGLFGPPPEPEAAKSEHPEGSPEFNEERTFLNQLPGTEPIERREPRESAASTAIGFASPTLEEEMFKEEGEETRLLKQNQLLSGSGSGKRVEVGVINFEDLNSNESRNKLMNEEPFGDLNLSVEFSLSNMVPHTDNAEDTAVMPSNPSAMSGTPIATSPDEEGLELDFEAPVVFDVPVEVESAVEEESGEIPVEQEGEFDQDPMEMFEGPSEEISEEFSGDSVEKNESESKPLEEVAFEISFGEGDEAMAYAESSPVDASEYTDQSTPSIQYSDDAAEPVPEVDPTYDVDFNVEEQHAEETSDEVVPTETESEATEVEAEDSAEDAEDEVEVASQEDALEDSHEEMEEEQEPDIADSEESGYVSSIENDPIFGSSSMEPTGAEYASSNLDTKQLELMSLSTGMNNNSLLSGRVYNWREIVEAQTVDPGIAEALMRTPFEKELEKHVAIQAVSLLSGSLQPISNWHMKVWRDINAWTYSTDSRDRIADDMFSENLYNEFFRFLVYLTPVLVQMFDSKFTFEGFVRQLGADPEKIVTACEPRSWDKGYLAEVGLNKYGPRFEKTQYQAFHLPGLGSQIFYDGKRRAVFFDEAYYRAKPVSFFLFGILNEIWGVRLGYHVCLNLKAREEIFPVLSSILAYHKMTAVQKVKLKLTQRNNPLILFLAQISPQKLASFASVIANTEARDIAKMQFSMRDHLYKILLAESLNLIGIVEFITQLDLVDGRDEFSYNDMASNSPHIESLLNFVAKLKL